MSKTYLDELILHLSQNFKNELNKLNGYSIDHLHLGIAKYQFLSKIEKDIWGGRSDSPPPTKYSYSIITKDVKEGKRAAPINLKDDISIVSNPNQIIFRKEGKAPQKIKINLDDGESNVCIGNDDNEYHVKSANNKMIQINIVELDKAKIATVSRVISSLQQEYDLKQGILGAYRLISDITGEVYKFSPELISSEPKTGWSEYYSGARVQSKTTATGKIATIMLNKTKLYISNDVIEETLPFTYINDEQFNLGQLWSMNENDMNSKWRVTGLKRKDSEAIEAIYFVNNYFENVIEKLFPSLKCQFWNPIFHISVYPFDPIRNHVTLNGITESGDCGPYNHFYFNQIPDDDGLKDREYITSLKKLSPLIKKIMLIFITRFNSFMSPSEGNLSAKDLVESYIDKRREKSYAEKKLYIERIRASGDLAPENRAKIPKVEPSAKPSEDIHGKWYNNIFKNTGAIFGIKKVDRRGKNIYEPGKNYLSFARELDDPYIKPTVKWIIDNSK